MRIARIQALGAEVLHLYREINLIYSFSEKLAAELDLERVARLTLQQARQMIVATDGVVMLLDGAAQDALYSNAVGAHDRRDFRAPCEPASFLPPPTRLPLLPVASERMPADAGMVTSEAFLSSRRPRKAGCLSRPSLVRSV